jgi:hypothetical protein
VWVILEMDQLSGREKIPVLADGEVATDREICEVSGFTRAERFQLNRAIAVCRGTTTDDGGAVR